MLREPGLRIKVSLEKVRLALGKKLPDRDTISPSEPVCGDELRAVATAWRFWEIWHSSLDSCPQPAIRSKPQTVTNFFTCIFPAPSFFVRSALEPLPTHAQNWFIILLRYSDFTFRRLNSSTLAHRLEYGSQTLTFMGVLMAR